MAKKEGYEGYGNVPDRTPKEKYEDESKAREEKERESNKGYPKGY